MDGLQFYHNINAHDELEWLGARANDNGVDCAYVRGRKLGTVTEIALNEIANHSWDTLISIMLGYRPAKLMRHVTRIVGYYSELQNWNPSKIAELHDRHNGNYAAPEDAEDRAVVAA